MKRGWVWDISCSGEGDAKAVDIHIHDRIGQGWAGDGVTAKKVLAQLAEAGKDAKTIRMRINSRGGDVHEGMAIYNALNEHPARKEATIDGVAASMGSAIAMVADKITMPSNALMMIHNPTTVAIGESKDMRTAAELLDKVKTQLVDLYASRSGQKPKDVAAAMDATTWMTGAEAKKAGYADAVVPAKKMAAELDDEYLDDRGRELLAHMNDGLEDVEPIPLQARPSGAADDESKTETEHQGPSDMKLLASLCAILCLAVDSSEEEVIKAAQKQSDRNRQLDKLETELGVAGDAALGKLVALKTSGTELEAERAKVKALEAKQQTTERAELVRTAVVNRQLTPAMKLWAEKAETPIDALKGFVAAAPHNITGAVSETATPAAAVSAGASEGQQPIVIGPNANGKKYEQMTPKERHELRASEGGEALYAEMRADWEKRGKPPFDKPKAA